MKTNRRMLVIPAAAVATVALLFGAYYQQPQESGTIETNTIVAAETFSVAPTTSNVETMQYDAKVASSTVVPITTDIESDLQAANFILPFLKEAHAVTSSQTSLTSQEWQSLPTGTNSIAFRAPDQIWFAGHGTNKIQRLNLTSGALTQWPVLSGTEQTALTLDPTGKVYFAMGTQDKIGRLDPATNSIIEWFLPTYASSTLDYIVQIAYDPISTHVIYNRPYQTTPAGATDQRIGKLNPATNQVTEWTLLCSSGSLTWCIERFGVDPVNGDIYFGEEGSNTIKRIRPSTPTTLTQWAIPQPSSNPLGVAVSSSQTVYAALNGGNRILQLVTTGPSANQVTQWLVPTAGNQPFWITTLPDGAVYFTEYNAGKIGRIVPSTNLITEWSLPVTLRPTQIITDPTGNLYWSVDNFGRIGRLS